MNWNPVKNIVRVKNVTDSDGKCKTVENKAEHSKVINNNLQFRVSRNLIMIQMPYSTM